MNGLLKKTVRFYQSSLSPFLGGHCRFHPSCSQYFLVALGKYRLDKALYFGLKRLLRCHPFHPGGFDYL